MRLTESQIKVIKTTISDIFGKDSSVYLFGSRVDDSALGGDIDLLIRTHLEGRAALAGKLKTQARLFRLIGDRKIDLITTTLGKKDSRAVVDEAINKGVEL